MVAEPSPGLGELSFINPHRQVDGAQRFHTQLIAAGAPRTFAGDPSLGDLSAVDGVEIFGVGRTMGLVEFLVDTFTTSFVVVADGEVVTQWYAEGCGPNDLFLGASMTKSVLACLVGQAVTAGTLSLDARVADFVAELADSAYADCTVLDLLSMTTGVAWQEDHRDPDSRASGLLAAFALGSGDSRALLSDIPAGVAPGQRFAYNTADSQVLDWVRERATGQTYAAACAGLWSALGCESDAVVLCDGPDSGVAMAGGGHCATARDWARIGLLQLTGLAGGERVLSQEWLDNSSRPAYPFTTPGTLPSTITTHAGFGWHWWPLDATGRRVTADGSRGQFTYLDRQLDVVVVKTSQWPYDEFTDRQCRDLSYLALPRIASFARANITAAQQKG